MRKTTSRPSSTPGTLIGAHCSIAGGLEHALYEGASIGCTCIQMFTHSNRQWGIPPLTEAEIEKFNSARKETGITDIMVHASYLINLASADPALSRRSITALADQLLRCEKLRIPLLVFHPGSAVGQSKQEGMTRVINAVNDIIDKVPHHNTLLLFENMAGQGSAVGSTLEELAYLYRHITSKARVGFCIDLCHAFAAGYAINTEQGYQDFWHLFDKHIGLNKLKAIHMNDSQRECGSHIDRHTHIGEGKIGLETFRRIMQDTRFAQVPKILETPRDTLEDHKRNLVTLQNLI